MNSAISARTADKVRHPSSDVRGTRNVLYIWFYYKIMWKMLGTHNWK